MFYEFIQYTYVWHSNGAITSAILGGVIGILLSLKRKKKSATILLYTAILLFVLYPLFSISSFNQWKHGAEQCAKNVDYVMVRGVCYKPVDGYVPINSWSITKDVGDAIKESRK